MMVAVPGPHTHEPPAVHGKMPVVGFPQGPLEEKYLGWGLGIF